MVFASGIYLYTILFKDDVEYGEFMSHVESIIQGSQ
jgi:hypothetical protein